ncbi:family 78 glycoside hydrolase catalytic domain [Bifidobacterium vespertilionis]|uniref:family 78 glycoside hydrolase catalytic domain n=1 Tax=Bifidobacterium vespertilionis TaxID=2562524 RepID=UPI001BDD454C|nr:alpha-L-rhamnosidase C-terminal domain-containing protein [Bifidobacterium vespertilionis]MBT1178478.1 alpha-L-rhamnosidase N-terminal domain-containing protein [Bifidobacterium vespertilionis]
MSDAAIIGTPYGLTTDDVDAPWNATARPRFAWMMRTKRPDTVTAVRQNAYEVTVSDDVTGREVWRSGRVVSGEQSNVRYAGPALEPGRPYSWRVRVWDGAGTPTAFGGPARFAVGLGDDDWRASWIESSEALDAIAKWVPAREDNRGPHGFEPGRSDTGNVYWYARSGASAAAVAPAQDARADSPIVRAIAYVCCAHDYELHVCGRRIGRGQNFDYPSESRYQAWDVTDAVTAAASGTPGANDSGIPAIELLCRWYGGGQGRCPDTKPALLAHMIVWHADGARRDLVTDGSWLVAPGPYGGDVLRNGEGDFVETWDANRANPAKWHPAVVLGAHPCADFPHLTAELGHVTDIPAAPVSVMRLGDGTTVADFGRIITGRFSVDFPAGIDSAAAGDPITLHVGYELDETGRVKTDAQDPANQASDLRFIVTPPADGQAFAYNAWDTLCFRYITVPPLRDAAEQALPLAGDAIRARIAHAEVPADGRATLATSNPMLDRVFELMSHSALHCATNQFMDTPTRERGQFLCDGFNISRATMIGWRERATTAKAIRQFLDSQTRWWSGRPEDSGKYNSVYPNVDLGRDIPDFTLMMPRWVREYYMQSGDLDLVREAMPYLERTADYPLRSVAQDGPLAGLVVELDGGGSSPKAPYYHGIIDWPRPGRFGYDADCAARTVINALAYRALDDVAWLARAVGDGASASRRREQARALREAINAKLFDAHGRGLYVDGLKADGTPSDHESQHASSYALAFGIAPDDPSARAKLADHVASLGMKQGPMTADVLVKALCDAGRRDVAVRLLTNPDDYGWARIIRDHDATFTWEQWQYPTLGTGSSQSHGWGAAALQYVVERILGVEVTTPGAATVRIDPAIEALDRIEGTVATQRGPVGVRWERGDEAGRGTLHVDLPANVTATIALPSGDVTVTGGAHDFMY